MEKTYILSKPVKTYIWNLINLAAEEKLPEVQIKDGKVSLIYHNLALFAEPYNHAEEIYNALKDFELSIPLLDKSIRELFRILAAEKSDTEVKEVQEGLFTYHIITTEDGFTFKLLKHTPIDVIFDEPEKIKFSEDKLQLVFRIKSDDLLAMTNWLNKLKFNDIQINVDIVGDKNIKLVITRDTSTALTVEKVFPAEINKEVVDQFGKKLLLIPREAFNYIPHELAVYKVTDRDDELVVRIKGAYKSAVKYEKEIIIRLEEFNSSEEQQAVDKDEKQPVTNDVIDSVVDDVMNLIDNELI